jgi:chemotaxis protein MotB
MRHLLALPVLIAFIAGCGVPRATHEALLKELDETRIALAQVEKDSAETEEQLRAQIEALSARIATAEERQVALTGQLEEARGNLSMYESKAGGLEEALQATRSELDELRRARAQAEKRLSMYRDLANRLTSMIKSGQLAVKIRDGKMVIELADSILFDTGRTDIKPDGRAALEQLATVLSEVGDRNFLVAGHTDNVPISSGRFRSNWELSTARAVEVVKFLQDKGVDPTRLAAAGYGEFDPVASNDDRESRGLNRRIEIILMPNIEELPALPDDLFEGS